MEYTRERLERYPEFSAMRVYDEVKKRGYVIGLLCHKTRFNGGMVLRITLAARNFEKGPEGRPFFLLTDSAIGLFLSRSC